MPIGEFRKRVTIQEVPITSGTDGGLVEGTPTTHAIRWATVATPTGSEKFRFDQITPELTHVVTLRQYLSTVTAKMRVLFETRTFEILAVRHDEMKHRWTILLCKEYS